MRGLVRLILRALRYRRRWGTLAAAAEAEADRADARHELERSGRRGPAARPRRRRRRSG